MQIGKFYPIFMIFNMENIIQEYYYINAIIIYNTDKSS